MPFDGSGGFDLVAGNPVVTGTTISSTVQNNTTSDFATGFETCLTINGQTLPTANIPMGGFRITGLGNASAVTDAARVSQVQNGSYALLSSVSGTNTITATASPTPAAIATGQIFRFFPANTNTGAVTLAVSGLTAFPIKLDGTALTSSQIFVNQAYELLADVSASCFHLLTGANAYMATTSKAGISQFAVQAEVDSATTNKVLTTDLNRISMMPIRVTTSGTSHDWTGIPAGTRGVKVSLQGVSLSGAAEILLQLGDAGGLETTGYVGSFSVVRDSVASANNLASGFAIVGGNSANVWNGIYTLTLLSTASNIWAASWVIGASNVGGINFGGGVKELSAPLDRVRLGTNNGTDTFDAGQAVASYER